MYARTIEKWLRDIFYNPGVWISISLMFLLCALPVVTWGCAWGLAAYYARVHICGDKVRCFPMLKSYCKRFFLPSLLMGILDLLFALAALLTLSTILIGSQPVIIKTLYAILFWGNCLFLLSALYRYPILVGNQLSLKEVLAKGILLTISHPGNTFLIFMVTLTNLVLSLLTGLGIFVFFPASIALLSIYHYLSLFADK